MLELTTPTRFMPPIQGSKLAWLHHTGLALGSGGLGSMLWAVEDPSCLVLGGDLSLYTQLWVSS